MCKTTPEEIIGYYEGENVIKPIFECLSQEEFREKYPGKKPVLASHLADDDDYVPDKSEEEEADFE
jgi:hypothetical protein